MAELVGPAQTAQIGGLAIGAGGAGADAASHGSGA